jgi:hypothetical protein
MNLDEYTLYGTLTKLPSGQIKAVHYFNKNQLTRLEFQTTIIPGFIQSVWCPISKILTIQYINSIMNGVGLGYALMAACIEDGCRAGMKIAELDDMSDRFMKDHNLYVNMGFVYIELGLPEMVVQIDDVVYPKSLLNPHCQRQNWEEEVKSLPFVSANTHTNQEPKTLAFPVC